MIDKSKDPNNPEEPKDAFSDDFDDLDLMDEQDLNNNELPTENISSGEPQTGISRLIYFLIIGGLVIGAYMLWPKGKTSSNTIQPVLSQKTIVTTPVPTPQQKSDIAAAFAQADISKEHATGTTSTAGTSPATRNLLDSLRELQTELFANSENGANVGTISENTIALQKSIDQFNYKLNQNSAQIESIEETLGGISKTLNKITDNFKIINDKIAQIDTKTASLGQDYQALKKAFNTDDLDVTQALPKPKENSQITYTSPDYVVYAIIPGRAWLKATDGLDISVVEGDELNKYGKILAIDAQNGVVVTSSGVVFK